MDGRSESVLVNHKMTQYARDIGYNYGWGGIWMRLFCMRDIGNPN